MQERRFLFITFILVLLIGAPAVHSIVEEPVFAVKRTETALGIKVSSRAPANAPTALAIVRPEHPNAIKSKSVVLDYDCKNENPTEEVEGNLLRLQGTSCIDESWKNITITNHANGFTASVIFLRDKKFTTDFINLQEGDNNLTIQATDSTGKAINQKLTVKRRIPASVSPENN